MRKLILLIKIYRKIKLEKRSDDPGFYDFIFSVTDHCAQCKNEKEEKIKPGWVHITSDKKGNLFRSGWFNYDKGWNLSKKIKKKKDYWGITCPKCMKEINGEEEKG